MFALYSPMLYSVCMNYKSNRNIVYSCKYHVIWCSKFRRDVLVEPVCLRLEELIRSIAAEKRAEVIELEIMPDHVHLLIEDDPRYGVHRLVKQIKGTTSRILRQEFAPLKSRIPTLWTNSYFVSTVGGAPLAAIKKCIEQQKDF